MRIPSRAFILSLALSSGVVYGQATTAGASTTSLPAASAAAQPAAVNTTAPGAPSGLLQPSLRAAQDMLTALKLDKWKKGSVRDEAEANVKSLLHDLESNVPPLLEAADSAPGSLSKAIPLIKHLDAFYDVLLRVEEASRVSAPSDQISALQNTLLEVNKARIAFDDQLATEAAIQEKQVVDLQATVRAQKEAPPQIKTVQAPPAPCKPATPARKKKKTTPPANPAQPTATPAQPTPH